MRFQRDYVLRMIEMMGDFFMRIAEILDDFEKSKELDKASKEYCGMSIDAALALDTATLVDLLTPDSRFIISELLYIKASTITRLSADETSRIMNHAAKILISLHDNNTVCEHRGRRLSDMLDSFYVQLSAENHLDAARFFASAEILDRVEDEVFHAVNDAEDRRAFITEGKALFYQIAKLPDDKLALGHLPRHELLTAISDLSDLDTPI